MLACGESRGIHLGMHPRGQQPLPARPWAARTPRPVAARAAGDASASTAQQLKQRVRELAGSRYGHDLDAGSRQQLQALADQLEALCPSSAPAQVPLQGSRWSLIYSTSDGSSGGKVGPFIAQVEQVFPADAPGEYVNKSVVGLVQADLAGVYSAPSPDKVMLEFKHVTLGLGPLKLLKRDFAAGQMRGFWRTVYADDEMRVFYTNKGNLFIMGRLQ